MLPGAGAATLPSGQATIPSDATLVAAPAGDQEAGVLSPGVRLAGNRYEVLSLLGLGGMGAVYKVRDRELDRDIALKVIRPELVSSPAILKRFKQEVLLARQVTHKNVVRIFDIGESEGLRYITMEFVEGVSLKTLIVERGKLEASAAVAVIRQVLEGLAAAHAQGVTHRDLKPQNIMITQDDRAIMMDFGIAHSEENVGLTKTGDLVGTPEYMSPEQAKGEHVDHRSDIYAVGIIFYELLTGKIPFEAKTSIETMYRRTHERATPPARFRAPRPNSRSAWSGGVKRRPYSSTTFRRVRWSLHSSITWAGRPRAVTARAAAVGYYEAFLAIQDGGEDPLAGDARARLQSLQGEAALTR